MTLEGVSNSSVGPAEAASAAARAQQLQELVNKAASADTPAGESSFAAALQAASAEGGAPPEAPEPAEAGEGVTGLGEAGEGVTGLGEVGEGVTGLGEVGEGVTGLGEASTSVSASSPYVSAESSAVGALDSAAAGGAEGAGYEASEAATLGSAYGTSSYATPTYLEDADGGYGSTVSDYATSGIGAADSASPSYETSLAGGADYGATADSLPTSGAEGAGTYTSLIEQEASHNGVEPALLQGLIEQESGFDPSAESSAGAQGLTQLMPSTAASLGVSDPLNPAQSIAGGAKLLGELLRQFDGNVSDALAAYNAGAGAVEQYGGVPPYPETEAYVAKVLANAQSYRGSTA